MISRLFDLTLCVPDLESTKFRMRFTAQTWKPTALLSATLCSTYSDDYRICVLYFSISLSYFNNKIIVSQKEWLII